MKLGMQNKDLMMQLTALKAVNNTLNKVLEGATGKKLTPEEMD